MPLNFQDMIARLQAYWAERGCVVMQPYHTEVGAGTFNPATVLRCLGSKRIPATPAAVNSSRMLRVMPGQLPVDPAYI